MLASFFVSCKNSFISRQIGKANVLRNIYQILIEKICLRKRSLDHNWVVVDEFVAESKRYNEQSRKENKGVHRGKPTQMFFCWVFCHHPIFITNSKKSWKSGWNINEFSKWQTCYQPVLLWVGSPPPQLLQTSLLEVS